MARGRGRPGYAASSKLYAPRESNEISNTPQQLFDGMGTLWGFFMTNLGAAPVYLFFFDKATAPTITSDTPKHIFRVLNASDLGSISEKLALSSFGEGCWVAAATAEDGTGAPVASTLICNVWYEPKR